MSRHRRNVMSQTPVVSMTTRLIGLPKSADSSDGRREIHLKCT